MKFGAVRSQTQAPKRYRWNETSRCYWCGLTCTYNGAPSEDNTYRATKEHIVPQSFGGGGGGNRVVACHRCNQVRGRDMRWIPFHKIPKAQRLQGCPMLRDGESIRRAT